MRLFGGGTAGDGGVQGQGLALTTRCQGVGNVEKGDQGLAEHPIGIAKVPGYLVWCGSDIVSLLRSSWNASTSTCWPPGHLPVPGRLAQKGLW